MTLEGSSRYKCIRKKCFLYYHNGAQKHEGFVGFENACSRAKTYVILTSLTYVYFYARYCCDSLECVYIKYKSCASTARELPDQYIFLQVKTWLLKMSGKAFYAKMLVDYIPYQIGGGTLFRCQSCRGHTLTLTFVLV